MHLNIFKYNYYEYITENIISHIYDPRFLIFMISVIMLHKYINFEKKTTKYFLMHFIFNMYVSFNTFTDTLNIIKYPYQVENVENYISFLVVIFHIYHIICYRDKIEIDEMIHHIWSVFILMPITWLYYCNIANASLFFMTGLPGGITYLLLVLKDNNKISSITEKYISKQLNMWLRIPGSVIVGYIIFVNAVISESYITYFSLLFCSIGSIWNGIYFGSTIIQSYAVSASANKLKIIS